MIDCGGGLAATGVLACATNAEARDQDEEGESEEFHRVGGNGETNLRDSCGNWPASEAAQNATTKCQICDIRVTFSAFPALCKPQSAQSGCFYRGDTPQNGSGCSTRAAACLRAHPAANPWTGLAGLRRALPPTISGVPPAPAEIPGRGLPADRSAPVDGPLFCSLLL